MKRIVAWIIIFCTVIVAVLPGGSKAEAYTITEKAGMRTADELSEAAAKALDEVSVTDKDMLDDVIKRSYENDFRNKTYIIKNEGEDLNTTYWCQYVHSQGDFSVSLDWNVEKCAATVGDNYYYTVKMSSRVSMSPFNYENRTIERWDEYMDVIRDVENRIGILNADLCDYQKIQLAYTWIKQNVKYGTLGHVSVSAGQEPIEAVLDGYAMCGGYTRVFNRFMHDCGIDSYYVSTTSHAYNLVKFNGKYYRADCQVGTLSRDEGYEQYNKNNKVLWYMQGLLSPIGETQLNKFIEYNAILHYDKDFVNSVEQFNELIDTPYEPMAEIVEPKCDEDGSFYKEGYVDEHCIVCGKVHSFTLPAAHTYKTVENKPSICTEEGEIKKVCSECGNEETEKVAMKPHDYKIDTADSDYDTEGWFKIVCNSCGKVYYEEYKDKLERPTQSETETTTTEESVTTPAYQESDLEKKDRGYGIITWYDAEKEDWFCKQGQFEMSMKREISGNGAYTDGLWVECGTLDKGRLYDKQAGKWVNAGDSVDCYFDVDSRTWKIYMKYYTEEPQATTTAPEEEVTTTSPATEETETVKPTQSATTVKVNPTTEKPQTPTTRKPQVTTKKPQTKKLAPPKRMSFKSVKNYKKKRISLKWKKIKGATKYQVKWVLGRGKKAKTKTKDLKGKTTSCAFKGLKKGKTYKVYIRAYNKSGWGKWSAVKKVNIKK
ncbi:fibronectin type III domain-containing protein [Eubacterium sp.]|uniref:fibronectin type III domain-containing protein n=1 Tax=Eubacterium sp. TaxID=142586 RepID=UPI00399A92CD